MCTGIDGICTWCCYYEIFTKIFKSLPVTHSSILVLPSMYVDFPDGQAVHGVSPALPLYVPYGHREHPKIDEESGCRPASHGAEISIV